MFRLSEEWIVDATREGNISRFINHSCDPNCYTQIIDVEGQKKIVVIANRPIEAGEEITYNYFFAGEDDQLNCKCGAINCSGRLN
jgi:SET domain-containing protein